MAKAVGIGGVFFRAKDPTGLLRWYADTLGLPVEAHGGSAVFTEPIGASAVFATFAVDTDYFGPSGQAFMINCGSTTSTAASEQSLPLAGSSSRRRWTSPMGASAGSPTPKATASSSGSRLTLRPTRRSHSDARAPGATAGLA